MKPFKHTYILFFLLTLSLFQSQAIAKNVAGKILFAQGSDAQIISLSGKSRQARRGIPIWEGDTMQSGKHRMQLRFTDGSTLALEPNSTLSVDEYVFNNKLDGKEKSFYTMVKGGLRAISGKIGHGKNKDAYRMKTAIASMGIRGTEYTIREQDGGIILRVLSGSVFIKTSNGELLVLAGQSVFVQNVNSAPQFINQPFNDTPPATNDEAGIETIFSSGDEVNSNGEPTSIDIQEIVSPPGANTAG